MKQRKFYGEVEHTTQSQSGNPSFELTPIPPFRLDLTAWTLRRRPENSVDRWDGRVYRRVLPLNGGPVEFAVTQSGPPRTPRLRVSIAGLPLRAPVKIVVTAALERLLGVRIDLAGFYRHARRDARLRQLSSRFRGMKPPRFATVFEGVANGIACQQLSLSVGIQLLNRLAKLCGVRFQQHDGETAYAFPRPEDVLRHNVPSFRKLGFSRQKGQALLDVAKAVSEHTLNLEGLSALSDDEAISRLRALKGVGRWTAEYVLLRGLGRTHLFPGDDVGARNKLQHWLHRATPIDYDTVRRILKRWQPYAGLIYFHLLLDGLDNAGIFEA